MSNKLLSQYQYEISQLLPIRVRHIQQFVDALSGLESYDLIIDGSIRLGETDRDDEGTIRFQGGDLEGRVGGIWKSLTQEGGSGVSTFVGLTDTPTEYIASDVGKFVRVNSTYDGLEFAELSTIPTTFVSLTDTPPSYISQGEKFVRVNAAENGLEFFTIDLSSYVPTTRTITINGTDLDLSADRSWSVGTVTQVTGGNGLTGTITESGNLTLGTPQDISTSSSNVVGTTTHSHNLDLSGVQINTGTGLSGGGNLSTYILNLSLDETYLGSNYVTIDTTQSISGRKTFTNTLTFFQNRLIVGRTDTTGIPTEADLGVDGNAIAMQDVVAYADTGLSVGTIFDNIPLATYSSPGLIEIGGPGNGLIVTGGILSVDPSFVGGGITETDLYTLGDARWVPLTRQIFTTNGLQGGGTLSTNLTLSPVYGTTVNTVAQGNDSRFHDQVTIGTANGLSLSGQILSLALSTTSTAGAMSSTQFNKLNGIAENADNYQSWTARIDTGFGNLDRVINSDEVLTFNSLGSDGITFAWNAASPNKVLNISVNNTVIRTTGDQSMSGVKRFTGLNTVIDGDLGIGFTAAQTNYKLHVAGNNVSTGDVVAFASSSLDLGDIFDDIPVATYTSLGLVQIDNTSNAGLQVDIDGVLAVDYTNFRNATTSQSGLVTTTTQTFGGLKSFNNGLIVGDNTASTTNGLIRYNSNDLQGRVNGAWVSLTQSGGTTYSIGDGLEVITGIPNDILQLDETYTDNLYVNRTGDTMSGILSITTTSGTGYGLSIDRHLSTGTSNAALGVNMDTTSSLYYLARFLVNGTTSRMVIRADGNVGIGTVSPGQALDVNGFIRSSSGYQVGTTTVIDSSRNITGVSVQCGAGSFKDSGGNAGIDLDVQVSDQLTGGNKLMRFTDGILTYQESVR